MSRVIRAAIINATGYVGAELARLLAQHPNFKIACVTGRSEVGKRLPQVFPHLWSVDLPIVADVEGDVDVIFSGLPHAAAAERLADYVRAGMPVVDASADFRLYELERYEQWYGEHPAPELLADSVYGLPELHRDAIREARLVGVPGCYPTSAILALAPLAEARLARRPHRRRRQIRRLRRGTRAQAHLPLLRGRQLAQRLRTGRPPPPPGNGAGALRAPGPGLRRRRSHLRPPPDPDDPRHPRHLLPRAARRRAAARPRRARRRTPRALRRLLRRSPLRPHRRRAARHQTDARRKRLPRLPQPSTPPPAKSP